MHGGLHAIDRLHVSLEQRFDAAVGEVSHPAVHAFRGGARLDEEPEPHALDPAADQQPSCDEHEQDIIAGRAAPRGARARVRHMLRIGASSHGESRLRMLRVVRRGDRHDARDLTVSCRFEGEFAEAFVDGQAAGLLPGEALKSLVHTTAREHAGGEIERFGLALCERLLTDHPRVTRARVEIAEQPWNRLEVGGKPQGQAFLTGTPERRTAAVTSNGKQVAVVSGIDQLTLLRTSGLAPPRRRSADEADPTGIDDGLQRLLVATLTARWTYTSADVTFGPYRQGVRAAIVETFGCHASRSIQQTLYAIADVVLSSYVEIGDVSLTLQERPYRPADMFRAGVENPDELFVAAEEPVGVVEVTVERAAH
jgi:urate oxidase